MIREGKRRRSTSYQPAAKALYAIKVRPYDGETVDVKYAGLIQAAQAFATAMTAGNVEAAELYTLDNEGEPDNRLARYGAEGV